MIRSVVTDLDGTFWGQSLTVPPAHLEAVRALEARDVEVMVATSRRRRVVAEHLGRVGFSPPAVVLDGALGVDLRSGDRFHDAAFPVAAAAEVLRLFRVHGIDPCCYVDEPSVDVVLPPAPSTSAAHVEYLNPIARTGDLDATVAAMSVYGFSVTGRPHAELRPLADDLTAFGAEFMVFPEEHYGGWTIVVAPPEVTKWSGVLAYARLRDVDAEAILAVGDGDNDVDLLSRAGVAVVVRGGAERALAVADHLIEGPEANGWIEILDLVDTWAELVSHSPR